MYHQTNFSFRQANSFPSRSPPSYSALTGGSLQQHFSRSTLVMFAIITGHIQLHSRANYDVICLLTSLWVEC